MSQSSGAPALRSARRSRIRSWSTKTRLLNPEGLRYADECARHKVLDVVGDLALAGLPMLGAYRSVRGGHKLNHAVLCALMADRSAWRVVEAEPARRSRGHVEAARNGRRHGRPGLRPGRVLTSLRMS